MKLSLDWLNQVRNSSTSQFFTGETFDQLAAQVPASFHQEHTVDDKHATIHANGPVYERNRTTAMGVWLTAPFASSYFSAIAGSTWTVTNAEAVAVEYALVGSTMTVGFYIENSTIGTAAATTLYITIPGNYRAIRRMFSTFAYDDNGTRGTGVVQVRPQSAAGNSGMTLELTKDPRASGTFSASGAFAVFGQIAFEIYQTDTQSIANETFSASGGVIAVVGGNTIHTFTSSGAFVVLNGSAAVTYLVVAGGGGGGTGTGGGGGGGAVKTGTQTLSAGSYAITIGAGGAKGTGYPFGTDGGNGTSSIFVGSATVTSAGGGGGGTNDQVGHNGASGGGGGANAIGGTATDGGGNGGNSSTAGGGGGGAAPAAGSAGGAANGGAGGAGKSSSISGTATNYGGGGGGGDFAGTAGTRGDDSAGFGQDAGAVNAATNRGGGGGGSSNNTDGGGGAGGAGVVILSYPTP